MKKMPRLTHLIVIGLLSLLTNPCWAASYSLDQAHSSIGFSIKHLMVSTLRGSFADAAGTIEFDPTALETFKATVTIQATSIDTNNEKRDNHLRSADFFDVANHPAITFTGKSLKKNGDSYVIVGDLTLLNVTKEISIPCGIQGPIQMPSGGQAIGISGQTTINRKDFGMAWNKSMDQGGLVVGEDVAIDVNIEAHQQ